MKDSITALSLFSGIGGVDLAFEAVGVETVAVCDVDPFCQETLQRHFTESVLHKDIKDLDGGLYEGVDILITTPPCQPVSVAGKRKGDEDGRWLWEESLRIVRESKPVFVFGENVKGLLTKGIEGITSDLEGEGYEVRTYLLAASDCGAIHQRERVFIVGFKDWRSIPDTSGNGCNGRKRFTSNAQTNERTEEGEKETQCTKRCSGVRTVLPFRHQDKQWATIPFVRGVDDGFPEKLDKPCKQRIKALGNSVVPQQALPFAEGIVTFLKEVYYKEK